MAVSPRPGPVGALLTAAAVRERAHEMLAACEAGTLKHWRLDRERLPATADFVIETIRANYPDLAIPFHARWRHFAAGGVDRWKRISEQANFPDASAPGRSAFDLAIISVLLDAGAGPDWSYVETDGTRSTRSEGLAIASLDMFAVGGFSSVASQPLRVDPRRLKALTFGDLAAGFQAGPENPLLAIEGRLGLLRALGIAVTKRPDVFGLHDSPRPGGLFDYLVTQATDGALPAPQILAVLLDVFGAIWPSRLKLAGLSLGDTWKHPAIVRSDATNGYVPFHKLSQWLAYSLIEPLQWAGVNVTDIDGLTGLPEYRNGGLFIDLGVIVARQPDSLTRPQLPESTMVVEWRALTVALLDELADIIRARLGLDRTSLPLARVLEGGTWAAGRRIARQLRADGSPPLAIVSDGTIF